MTVATDHKIKAALFITAAVGVASAQDAIVKSMAGSYPAYETMIIRGLASTPILVVWLALTAGFGALATPLLGWLLLRGFVLAAAYLSFILSIAAMPIANAVAIYFTMPFILSAFSGPLLKEHVPGYRWWAMIAAFIGVLIMSRPGAASFEPASLLALFSAIGYAAGQMMSRSLSQRVDPIVMGSIQNFVYLVVGVAVFALVDLVGIHATEHKSLVFLTRSFVWPTLYDAAMLGFMGALATIAMMLFINAYKSAPANFVAPFEYTGMIWAVGYGLLLFGDFPDLWNWLGMAVVVAAGLWMMWKDTRHKTG